MTSQPPDRKDQELPEAWREQPSGLPPQEPQPASQNPVLMGCGTAAVIFVAIVGLLFGSCLLMAR